MNPLLITRNLRTDYLKLITIAFVPRQAGLSRHVLRDKAEGQTRWQRSMKLWQRTLDVDSPDGRNDPDGRSTG